MRKGVGSFSFPPSFRKPIVSQVRKILNQGECLQLIGLFGGGKTVFLTEILPREIKSHQVFYFDLNLLTEKSTPAAINLLASVFLDKTPSSDTNQALQKIKDFLKTKKEKEEKTLIILDHFKNLAGPEFKPFFQTLKALFSQYRFYLSFLFAVNRQINDYSVFAPLGTSLAENLVFLPPLSRQDSLFFLREQAQRSGIKLSPTQEKEIIKASGGFMRTLKKLVQAGVSPTGLAKALKEPWQITHLNYHFEELLKNLDSEKETLSNLIWEKLTPNDEAHLNFLSQLGLLNHSGKPTYPLFFKFLKHKLDQRKTFAETLEEKIGLERSLTRNEYKASKFLFQNKSGVSSREDLINAVWGKEASIGVSDHALDQLIHRLRQKLSSATPPLNLTTIRGRGHRLSLP